MTARLLLDQNLSHHLVPRLVDVYPDALHVRDLGMAAASDADVWQKAQAEGRIIVTKDSDFNELTLLGGAAKIVWIRVGNSSTAEIEELLRRDRPEIEAFADDPEALILELD